MKKRLLIYIALAYFPAWLARIVVEMLRAKSHGVGLLAPGSWLSTAIEVGFTLEIAACWFGSIYTWLQKGGTSAIRVVSVVFLVLFGMLVGAFYILLNARYLEPSVGSKAASLPESAA